jgi:lauroyl/myristoyl acyltransferase
MIQVIMGLKGSGKTKKLIDAINAAVANAQGDVVCIEYGNKLTYDVNYRVRLVNAKEYEIDNLDKLKGLLSGLHAGNFDITNVYIDNLYKTIGSSRELGEEFIAWCAEFAKANNMNITVTVSDDPALASEAVKAYLI